MSIVKRTEATAKIADEATIIDVRAPYEWEDTGVIKGSILVPLYDELGMLNENFVSAIEKEGLNKQEPIYIICHSGYRSQDAAAILTRCGYKDAISLDGGISLLMREGYSLTPYTKDK